MFVRPCRSIPYGQPVMHKPHSSQTTPQCQRAWPASRMSPHCDAMRSYRLRTADVRAVTLGRRSGRPISGKTSSRSSIRPITGSGSGSDGSAVEFLAGDRPVSKCARGIGHDLCAPSVRESAVGAGHDQVVCEFSGVDVVELTQILEREVRTVDLFGGYLAGCGRLRRR